MPRIRLALLIARLNIGGPATHVVQLASGLPSSRFEVSLVAGREGRGEGSMRYLAEQAGVAPIIIPGLSPDLGPGDLLAFFRLVRFFRRWRPDVVHTHTAKAGALGRLAARLTGVPVVVHTFHGHVLRGYFPRPAEVFFRWIERALAQQSDRIITLSAALRDDLLDLRVAPPEKITVIPLGMDLDRLLAAPRHRGSLRAELEAPPGEPLIGIVGRLVPIKNHDLFLEAARCMVDSGRSARFVIVGDGELREVLQARAEALGLSRRVTFLGWREDLLPVYSDLDLLALTSDNEGTPVAVIEAMAAGLPVVATSVGGVPDVIEDGRTGRLVPAREPEQMAQAWRWVLEDVGRARGLGDRARQVAEGRFGRARMLREMAELYETLLAQHTPQRQHRPN